MKSNCWPQTVIWFDPMHLYGMTLNMSVQCYLHNDSPVQKIMQALGTCRANLPSQSAARPPVMGHVITGRRVCCRSLADSSVSRLLRNSSDVLLKVLLLTYVILMSSTFKNYTFRIHKRIEVKLSSRFP